MKIKYPRTLHLPSSPGKTSDDKVHNSYDAFKNGSFVITEKMDGENTTLYREGLHARSLTYSPHPARHWIRAEHAKISYKIPKGWRVCGENVFARHSVSYDNLDGYFYLFSVWDQNNICLSWEETEMFAKDLGFPAVKVLHIGEITEGTIKGLEDTLCTDKCEGFVIRPSGCFLYEDFKKVVGKWVRNGHVQTDKHWMMEVITKNLLK